MTKKTLTLIICLIMSLTCFVPANAYGDPEADTDTQKNMTDDLGSTDPADDTVTETTAPRDPADDSQIPEGSTDPAVETDPAAETAPDAETVPAAETDPAEETDSAEETDPLAETDPAVMLQSETTPMSIAVVRERKIIRANHTLQATNPADMTEAMTRWTTSNKRVATVSSAGVIKGRRLGRATICGYDSNGNLRKVVIVKVVLGRDYTLFVAYRGRSSRAPENTLPAFREAVKAGFGGIELDIWESKTTAKSSPPLILVMHDNNLKYKTGVNKKTNRVNWANRKNFKIRRHVRGLRKYGPQKIPTLNEALKCIYRQARVSGSRNFIVELDVKSKLSDRAVKHIIRMVGRHRVHILCANIKTLRKFKKYRKYRTTEIWCCTGSNKASVRNKKIRNARKYHFDGISLPIRNVNVATVRRVRSYGMKMGIHGVRTAYQVQKWKRYGVCRFNMAPKVFR